MTHLKIRGDKSDFANMSWHDVCIHAVAFYSEVLQLRLDIDYILKWEKPTNNENRFHFVLTPATIIFDLVTNTKININNTGNVSPNFLYMSFTSHLPFQVFSLKALVPTIIVLPWMKAK